MQERPAEGSCAPVLCPLGALDVPGDILAAREDWDEIRLLLDSSLGLSTASTSGAREYFALTSGDQAMVLGSYYGTIAAAATDDGFVVAIATVATAGIPSHGPREPNEIGFQLWRVSDERVLWRQSAAMSSESSYGEPLAFAVRGSEFAVAYLWDIGGYDQVWIVERRALSSGEVLERRGFYEGTPWSSVSLAYTEHGLQLVWSPDGQLRGEEMYVATIGGATEPLPRSRAYGAVALLSTGELAVARAAPAGGRLTLRGTPILMLRGRNTRAKDLLVVETEFGTAVTFSASGRLRSRRVAVTGVVGDSGAALELGGSLGPTIVPLAPGRALVASRVGARELQLAVLTCDRSAATHGLRCETPADMRLGSGRY